MRILAIEEYMREIGVYNLIIFILFVASLLIIAIGVKLIKSGKMQYKGITEAVIKKVDKRYVSRYVKWKNYIEYIYYINGIEYIAYEDICEITEVIHQDSKIEIHYDLNNPKKSYYNEQQVVYEKKLAATFLFLLGGTIAFCTFVEMLPWVIYLLLK